MSLISKKLRVFMTVVRCGTVSGAAEELSLTISPISRMISEFESYYNKKLFIRNGKGLNLTDEGIVIHNKLKHLYEELCQIELDIKPERTKKKEISIYFDWGNEFIIKEIQTYMMKNEKDWIVSCHFLDKQNEISAASANVESMFFVSRDIFINNKKAYTKSFTDRLCRVEAIGAVNTPDTLILCKEQNLNPRVRQVAEFLKTECGSSVLVVGTNELMREMILDGAGFGIIPERNKNLLSWSGTQFENSTLLINEKITTFVYHSLPDYLLRKIDRCLQRI